MNATRAQDHRPAKSSRDERRRGLPVFLATAPAVGVALLPKISCPACWPAYAALASSLGLGALNYGPYLFPLTVAGLAAALAGLAFRARSRRGYGPLALGALGGAVMLVGKFVYDLQTAMYGGIALLIGASIWNAWPKRRPGPARLASLPARGSDRRDADETRTEVDTMTTKRKVEIFSAGCPVCQEAVDRVRALACPDCDVRVLDMTDPAVAARAKTLGVGAVPAVAVDGKLASCCAGRGVDEQALRAAGVGVAKP